jgi:hypothetical protein
MSLTEVAQTSRKVIKFGSVILITIIVGKLVLDFSINLYKQLNPAPPPPPTVEFGKLPALKFPEKELDGKLTFILETPTGAFPETPDRQTVYFIPATRPNLLALDKAKQDAHLIGFDHEPEAVSERIYKWTKSADAAFTLQMDIFTGTFKMEYNWPDDPNILLEKNLPGLEQAKVEAKNHLRKINKTEDDILEGRYEVQYLKANVKDYFPAASLSEANFVRVDIFRSDYNKLPVLTPNPNKGIITIIFSGSSTASKRIVYIDFNYFPVLADSLATYPIKTPAAAWEELKASQGYVASWDRTKTNIVIRRIYFGYYDSYDQQQFLQPIIVFEGDNNFHGYIPAISPDWVE